MIVMDGVVWSNVFFYGTLVALIAGGLWLVGVRGLACRSFVSLFVLGSGGHTAEMLQMLGGMLPRLVRAVEGSSRVYVVAKTDTLSADKAVALEERLGRGGDGGDGGFRIERIDRAREVGQSYVTSVATTLWSFLTTASMILRVRPGMVVVNGPGTCLPIVVWARVLVPACRVYYVESVARVDHVSLTGKLMLRFGLANGGFFVQWEELADKLKERGHGEVVYRGRVY